MVKKLNENSPSFSYLLEKKVIIDQALARYLEDNLPYPPLIFEAVRYSLFAGGKRIRPILCIAALEALGRGGADDYEDILPVACALEMIHTYSLIHDDLPAMDNDDYRRGIPTSHKVFGEDIAILSGDALLTQAFCLMSRADLMTRIDPATRLKAISIIAEAAGMTGLIGGQVMDLKSEGKQAELDTLYQMHNRKTGALIIASLQAGGLLAGADPLAMEALMTYGQNIGLSFQIADDLLNVEGDMAVLGKNTGSDANRGKVTFPALLGCDESRKLAQRLKDEAVAALSNFDHRAEPLRKLAEFIVDRRF